MQIDLRTNSRRKPLYQLFVRVQFVSVTGHHYSVSCDCDVNVGEPIQTYKII